MHKTEVIELNFIERPTTTAFYDESSFFFELAIND